MYKCFIGIENSTRKYILEYIYIGNMSNYILPNNEKQDVYDMNNRCLCLISDFMEKQIKNYESWKDIELQ